MDTKLETALKEAAMGHLLGEYDAADIAMELAEEHPDAWRQLPRAAIAQGLAWAESHATDEEGDDDTLPSRIDHMINSGAITHELNRMIAAAKARMTPLPG